MNQVESVLATDPAVTDDQMAHLETHCELGGSQPVIRMEDGMAVIQERLNDQAGNSPILIGDDDIAAVVAGVARTHCEPWIPEDIREWQAEEGQLPEYTPLAAAFGSGGGAGSGSMNARDHLLGALTDTAELLRAHAIGFWPERLESHAERIRLADIEAIPTLLADFGGMGSFNDVWIDPRNGHRITPEQVQSVNQRLGKLQTTKHLAASAEALRLMEETR